MVNMRVARSFARSVCSTATSAFIRATTNNARLISSSASKSTVATTFNSNHSYTSVSLRSLSISTQRYQRPLPPFARSIFSASVKSNFTSSNYVRKFHTTKSTFDVEDIEEYMNSFDEPGLTNPSQPVDENRVLDQVEAAIEKTKTLYREGDYETALNLLQRVKDAKKWNDPRVYKGTLQGNLFGMQILCQSAKELKEREQDPSKNKNKMIYSEILLDHVLKENKDHEFLLALSNTFSAFSSNVWAVRVLKTLCNIDNKDPVPLYNLGFLYERSGRIAEAMEAYEHCINRDRHFSPAYYRLTYCYRAFNEHKQAADFYEAFVRLREKKYGSLGLNAWLNLATLQSEGKLFEKANANFEKAHKMDPKNPDIIFNWIICLISQQKEAKRKQKLEAQEQSEEKKQHQEHTTTTTEDAKASSKAKKKIDTHHKTTETAPTTATITPAVSEATAPKPATTDVTAIVNEAYENTKIWEDPAIKLEHLIILLQELDPFSWKTYICNMHLADARGDVKEGWQWVMAAWESVFKPTQEGKPINLDAAVTVARTAFHYAILHNMKDEANEFRTQSFMKAEAFEDSIFDYIRRLYGKLFHIKDAKARLYQVVFNAKEKSGLAYSRLIGVIAEDAHTAESFAKQFVQDCGHQLLAIEKLVDKGFVKSENVNGADTVYDGIYAVTQKTPLHHELPTPSETTTNTTATATTTTTTQTETSSPSAAETQQANN